MEKKHQLFVLSSLLFLTAPFLNAQSSTIDVTVPKASEVNVSIPSVELVVDGLKVSKTTTGNPTTPAVEKEKSVNKEQKSSAFGIISEKRYPPDYFKKAEVADEKNIEVGEVSNERVAAYLQAPLISVSDAKVKLEAAGFSVISSYKIDKKGEVLSLVFSDDTMLKNASKKGRGFAADLRLLVDAKSGQISITNPIYLQKAFLQDDFDEASAKSELKRLRDNFEGLQNSKDVVKFIRLPRYKFMNSMPVYEDMIEISSGTNEVLLAQARASKKVVFEQPLANGSVLLGVKLSRRTSKFVKKIGYQNAELLPYPLLIEDGKAKILAPKYYIAVMYPLLSMSEFMTIATVPGAVKRECGKIFR